MKLWNLAGRGQSITSPPPPTIISTFSPSTRSASQHPPPPSLSSATDLESQTSSYPYPSCFALPSFFIKLPKRQSVAVVAWRGIQLAGPAVAGAQLTAPLPLHPIGWPTAPLRF